MGNGSSVNTTKYEFTHPGDPVGELPGYFEIGGSDKGRIFDNGDPGKRVYLRAPGFVPAWIDGGHSELGAQPTDNHLESVQATVGMELAVQSAREVLDILNNGGVRQVTESMGFLGLGPELEAWVYGDDGHLTEAPEKDRIELQAQMAEIPVSPPAQDLNQNMSAIAEAILGTDYHFLMTSVPMVGNIDELSINTNPYVVAMQTILFGRFFGFDDEVTVTAWQSVLNQIGLNMTPR